MDAAFISSHPPRSTSQHLGQQNHPAGSPRATKRVSQEKSGPLGGAGVQRQQQQQQQYDDRRRSCSAAESQIESQIAAMRTKMLAMASDSTGWQPVRLSSDDARPSVPYTPSTMPASLRAQRAAVVARLDAKATQYRDAALKDGSLQRLMLQQMAIAGDLGRGARAHRPRTDTVVEEGLFQIQMCDDDDDDGDQGASPAGVPAALS
jgi:hypothetical protein